MSSDERQLRAALEQAQGRVKALERLLAEESEDREALGDEVLTLRQALDDAEQRLLGLPQPPGVSREFVRLQAQVHAQQLQLTNLKAEREKLLARVAELEKKVAK